MNWDDVLGENRVAQYDYAQKILEAENDGRVLDNTDPRQWATRFSRDKNLHHFQGGFYEWSGSAYRRIADEVIEAESAEFLSTCYALTKKEVHIPFKPTRKTLTELIGALRNIRLLDVEPPCWIEGNGPTASEIVSFPNGLLHVLTGEFLKPTPGFFTLTAQEFNYDPNALKPKGWIKLLHTIWPDDEESRICLMQYFGYLLSGDTSLQKILVLIGPPGSGKSTIMRVMEYVLGKDNSVSTDSESLSDKYGLELLLGKSIAFLPDESFDFKNCKVGIDRLKRISGCDTVSVRPMRQAYVDRRLPVRFVITTNETPRLRASAEAMIRRFLMLRTPRFEGRVDIHLTKKLCKEAPGILNLAIESLKQLIVSGFVQPESGKEDLDEVRDLGDNVAAFIKECVVQEGEVDAYVLYQAYKDWAEVNGEHRVDNRMFGRQLRSVVPHVKRSQRRGPVGRYRIYEGVTIDNEE